MRLLELFCGTKSVGEEFKKKDYEVISLDYNPKFNATHTEDILTWNYKQYEPNYFDVIWASPDCSTFSLQTWGKYRKKDEIYGRNNKYQERATLGNNMIIKLIEILQYFNCNFFIENPRALLQHFPPLKEFIKEINGNVNVVYYGNYDWGFPKPTNIWSNLKLWENETLPIMSPDTYYLKPHKYKGIIRSYYAFNTSSKNRSKIPPKLINRLMSLLD